VVLLLGGALLISSACNKESPTPNPDKPAPAVQAAGPAVTADEARQFAERLSQATKVGDLAKVHQLIRWNDLRERLVNDLDLTATERLKLRRASQDPEGRKGFGLQILNAIAGGGSYKLLRVHSVKGRPRALFRLITANGSVNYHDYTLARFPDGGIGMEDVYDILRGEPISQTWRRMFTPFVARLRQSERLKGGDADDLKDHLKFIDMMKTFQKRQFAQAAASYRQLSQKFQRDNGVLIMHMQVLMQQGEPAEKDYLAAMEKFRKLYPDDAAIDLISVDYYFLKKQYDEAARAVHRFEKAIGGDPYLGALRGNMLLEAKRYGEAREVSEQAIKAEPTLENAYRIRVRVSLHEQRYDAALEWLKKMVEACHVTVEDLATVPEYAGFVQSPQYREWQKWYAARSKK
jgi:tetratricopeptide (TPR) repeat protein